jgi:hypothetical protein
MKARDRKINCSSVSLKYTNLIKALKWLNENQGKIAQKVLYGEMTHEFCYPYYWGMPKSIVRNLDDDDHDYIRALTDYWYDDERVKFEQKKIREEHSVIFEWSGFTKTPFLAIHNSLNIYGDCKPYIFNLDCSLDGPGPHSDLSEHILVLAKSKNDAIKKLKESDRYRNSKIMYKHLIECV